MKTPNGILIGNFETLIEIVEILNGVFKTLTEIVNIYTDLIKGSIKLIIH